jgi:ferredoxin
VSRPLWFVALLKASFPGRFLLAQATRLPLVGDLVDRWLFWGDDLIYLPQDRVVPVNQPIESPGEMVLPSQVVAHFIREAQVHWIMDRCICRDASGCQDYPADLGCLFLGEAAAGINPRLGRRVTREEALAHVERCQEAGLVHLVGRNKLDQVWLGVGPGERLLTVCNCCPCCCLWRMLPDIAPRIGAKVSRMPGVTVAVSDCCLGCGTCTAGVCFADAIRMDGGRAVIGEGCRGCGRCVGVCPNEAIELSIRDGRLVEASIARIAPLVDLS